VKNETQFYLRDTRSNVGSTCTFWNKGGNGYGSNLNNAEIFTKEQAQRYADEKRHFIPLSKTEVDKLDTMRVDMQYLGKEGFDKKSEVDLYLVQANDDYDGNDIYFFADFGITLDPSDAKMVSKEDAPNGYKLYPLEFINSIARRTIQAKNINLRVMLQGSGIKYRSPRKQRPTTGKTRGNCSECGRIAWDYNPYEQPQCSDECLQKHIESVRRGY